MTKELRQVEMHGSYVFDCPECGVENWQRCITEFLNKNNPEDAACIESLYGLEALSEDRAVFRMVSHPDTVKCKECKTTFKAVSPDADDDEDEDEFDSDMEI